MLKHPPFTAVLLAGGRSSRMGRDKAALELDGIAMWRRQLDTLRACNPAELFVSGREDGPWAGTDIRVVPDAAPRLGPLAGIAAALEAAQHPKVMVLAVDMPWVYSAWFCNLQSACAHAECGIFPDTPDGPEPLAAIYPKAAAGLARECLHGRDRSLRRFVNDAVHAGFLDVIFEESAAMFRSVNTPEDFERAWDWRPLVKSRPAVTIDRLRPQ